LKFWIFLSGPSGPRWLRNSPIRPSSVCMYVGLTVHPCSISSVIIREMPVIIDSKSCTCVLLQTFVICIKIYRILLVISTHWFAAAIIRIMIWPYMILFLVITMIHKLSSGYFAFCSVCTKLAVHSSKLAGSSDLFLYWSNDESAETDLLNLCRNKRTKE
jgi:hypothetical protein